MPGCQLLSGVERSEDEGGASADTVCPDVCICPVDAALLAAGGRGSPKPPTCTGLLGCCGSPAWTGCFPRRPDKNALVPASPDADLSRCREDCPGGGGKAGDIGADGELRAELLVSRGEAVNPVFSNIGEPRAAC